MTEPAPSLDAVRARIDGIDGELLALLDERAALAREVAAAKRAAGQTGFGLRPERETAILRRLLARPRTAANEALVLRLWRELMAESLAGQGPFQLTVWPGKEPARAAELARARFGAAPPLRYAQRWQEAIAAARETGGVAVLMLDRETPWWGRLLAEPRLRVFAALPELSRWGPLGALAVAEVEVGPTGADETYWAAEAVGSAAHTIDALGRIGFAARLLAEGGGLRLFGLAGFVQAHDPRLADAPGRLKGVIGAAPLPFDTSA